MDNDNNNEDEANLLWPTLEQFEEVNIEEQTIRQEEDIKPVISIECQNKNDEVQLVSDLIVEDSVTEEDKQPICQEENKESIISIECQNEGSGEVQLVSDLVIEESVTEEVSDGESKFPDAFEEPIEEKPDPPPKDDIYQGEDYWELSAIDTHYPMKAKRGSKNIFYRVQWKLRPGQVEYWPEDDNWLPENGLKKASIMLNNYWVEARKKIKVGTFDQKIPPWIVEQLTSTANKRKRESPKNNVSKNISANESELDIFTVWKNNTSTKKNNRKNLIKFAETPREKLTKRNSRKKSLDSTTPSDRKLRAEMRDKKKSLDSSQFISSPYEQKPKIRLQQSSSDISSTDEDISENFLRSIFDIKSEMSDDIQDDKIKGTFININTQPSKKSRDCNSSSKGKKRKAEDFRLVSNGQLKRLKEEMTNREKNPGTYNAKDIAERKYRINAIFEETAPLGANADIIISNFEEHSPDDNALAFFDDISVSSIEEMEEHGPDNFNITTRKLISLMQMVDPPVNHICRKILQRFVEESWERKYDALVMMKPVYILLFLPLIEGELEQDWSMTIFENIAGSRPSHICECVPTQDLWNKYPQIVSAAEERFLRLNFVNNFTNE